MFWPNKIYTAPPNSAEVILGRTLPSLLDEACDRTPNHHAFQQPTAQGWQSLSNLEFRSAAEELALGLLDLELEKSTRICLFMHSDVNFCIADMGCLLAKLIDVPIYPAEAPENIIFIMQHSEAKALIISNPELLEQVAPYLWKVPNLKIVIVAEVTLNWQQQLPLLPPQIQVFSLSEVRSRGKAELSPTKQQQLRSEIAPNDLATNVLSLQSTLLSVLGQTLDWLVLTANSGNLRFQQWVSLIPHRVTLPMRKLNEVGQEDYC
ncbi:MAG: AMP-binding protein [Merismopedia sp. SIO2A8]|nr:AMP-binding protein [Merismopedia sp. SIO2A8]